MSCKNVSKKSKNGFNIDSITGILNLMLGAFKSVETPIAPLPPLLIMFGAKLRPGLSAIDIASKIIARRSESGGKSGDVFADGPNVDDAMEVIRAQEFIDAIHNDAVVNVVIPPGIALMAVGIDSTGMPVITHGATTTMGVGDGIMR